MKNQSRVAIMMKSTRADNKDEEWHESSGWQLPMGFRVQEAGTQLVISLIPPAAIGFLDPLWSSRVVGNDDGFGVKIFSVCQEKAFDTVYPVRWVAILPFSMETTAIK